MHLIYYNWIRQLGRFSLTVAMFICVSVFFKNSHWPWNHMISSQASHRSTQVPPPPPPSPVLSPPLYLPRTFVETFLDTFCVYFSRSLFLWTLFVDCFMDTFFGHFFDTFCGHSLWTLFVNSFCEHILWSNIYIYIFLWCSPSKNMLDPSPRPPKKLNLNGTPKNHNLVTPPPPKKNVLSLHFCPF